MSLSNINFSTLSSGTNSSTVPFSVRLFTVLWVNWDYRQLGRYRYLWGLLAVGLLLVTLLFGFSSGGAKSWLRIGGIGIEPEEFYKVNA